MTTFEKIMLFLDSDMTEPTPYGWFHIMFIAIIIATTYLLCKHFKDCDFKIFKRIALISWIVIIVLEIYKQVNFAMDVDDGVITGWSYSWYSFPFQFCSSPMYILPFIFLSKNEKFIMPFTSFMSTFSLFAGLAVLAYPGDVFIQTIGINIQTMIHHGLQIVLGIFFIVHNKKNFNLNYYYKGIPVFVTLVLSALVLNEVVYKFFTIYNLDNTFNMFYISRHFECTLPVLSLIYPLVPYLVFLIIYLIGFTFVSFIIFKLSQLILNKTCKVKTNEQLQVQTTN